MIVFFILLVVIWTALKLQVMAGAKCVCNIFEWVRETKEVGNHWSGNLPCCYRLQVFKGSLRSILGTPRLGKLQTGHGSWKFENHWSWARPKVNVCAAEDNLDVKLQSVYKVWVHGKKTHKVWEHPSRPLNSTNAIRSSLDRAIIIKLNKPMGRKNNLNK